MKKKNKQRTGQCPLLIVRMMREEAVAKRLGKEKPADDFAAPSVLSLQKN